MIYVIRLLISKYRRENHQKMHLISKRYHTKREKASYCFDVLSGMLMNDIQQTHLTSSTRLLEKQDFNTFIFVKSCGEHLPWTYSKVNENNFTVSCLLHTLYVYNKWTTAKGFEVFINGRNCECKKS